jgi:1-acyl-sn-glycerol-3-phosphate acyltransferase
MIRNLLLFVVIVAMALPVAIFGFAWCLITGDVMPLYRASFFIVRLAFPVAGIRIQVVGLENIPARTACIFMSNHVSNLDPPVLTSCIPGRVSVFYKQSLSKLPLLGYAMRLADFVPVTREGHVEAAQESVRFARAVLAKGIHIVTFVEGTRSREGQLLPFKKGPFYLAQESGAPCIPVSISGTEGMMRKGSMRVLPGSARVEFHAPVFSAAFVPDAEGREALMLAVRSSILSGLPDPGLPDKTQA